MQQIKNDPIGNALKDFYQGETTVEIIVHSTISDEEVLPVEYLFRTHEKLPQIEKIAIENCKGKILDIGAGSGCHSLILQSKGMEVLAIDISEGAIEVINAMGVKNSERINIFNLKNQVFDTLLMLMNGIGITETIVGLNKFLQHAKNLLTSKGQIIVESSDIKYMFEEEDGSMWIDLNANYYGEVSYQMEYKSQKSDFFNWLYVDYSTLKDNAANNGYECEILFEGETNYLAKLTLKQ